MQTLTSWRRSYAVLLTATLLCVAAADFFFYGHMIGWTAAAFVLILLTLLAFRDTRFLRPAGGKLVLLAAIGLLVALVEQPTWLNVIYIILCIGALAIVNTFGWQRDFPEWAKRWADLLATGWRRPFSDNSVVIRCLARYGVSPVAARAVLAWVIPVALASVFLAIFAWANPILAEWLGRSFTWIGHALKWLPELFNLPRMMFWLAFAIFAWTLLRARAKRWKRNRISRSALPPPLPGVTVIHPVPLARTRNITSAMVVRCLILFNLVFLAENVLDVRFLGHKELLLPTGIEYKEYVRRGAYPLVAAALMAGAFVLITFRSGSETERSRWARRLVYLWIAQTIFLTATAAWRLEQYVQLSELTRLRVASTIWFVLVGMGLSFIIWRVLKHKSNRWLLNANALAAAFVLYPCCFINFDGMIADFNVRHCREGGGPGSALDLEYFRALGTTALAPFDEIRPRVGREPGTEWRRTQAAEVSADLHCQLAQEQSDWRAWTFRRARAVKAIERQETLVRARQQSSPASIAAADSTHVVPPPPQPASSTAFQWTASFEKDSIPWRTFP